MIPQLIDADEKQRAPGRGFHMHEFMRMLRFVRPYRASLILGLIITIAFAGLHTIGIGTAFPIFKVLLEKEGVHGWANRTVVGDRFDLAFAPLSDPESARIVQIKQESPLFAQGVRAGDDLLAPDGTKIRDFLNELASAPTGQTKEITVGRPGDRHAISIELGAVDTWPHILHVVVSWLPVPASRSDQLRTLIYLLAVLVVIVVLANICRFTGEVLIASAILRAMMNLRDRLYEQTLHLPMSFFAGVETSDIVTRFVQDVQEIQRGLVTLFGKAIREPIRAIFLMILAFSIDWRVTIVIVFIVPIAAGIFLIVGRKAKKANYRLLHVYGEMIGALTASLQNLRVVKAYTAEEHERSQLDSVDHRMVHQQLKLARLDAFLSPMLETVGVVAGSLLTIWLASLVLGDSLSISDFTTLGLVLSMVFDPLRKLSDVYVRIQRSTAGAERIFAVFDRPSESNESCDAKQLVRLSKAIEYESVSFTYPNADQPALKDINLRIERGETIAMVGPNGSGKTTLASMIPRLFDPNEGQVLYDGIDLRQARLETLRRHISWVSQEAVVFSGTPIANITYGEREPDRERAIEAARKAYADEFISAIPGGYDAALAERGTSLSGGQRQRLAIARAVYRDAPILIFDEATSQVDSESEQKIQAAVREFAVDRTTIIIAHRLSTIQFADRIVVMDAGQIIDVGTHKELFERCHLYQGLCETQFVTEIA